MIGFKEPPDCGTPTRCRFVSQGASTTLVHYPTVYDRSGKEILSEIGGNITTQGWKCQTCGISWTEQS